MFEILDAPLVAASVDPIEDARKVVGELSLTFPIGCGLDALAVAERLGCFYQAENPYLHASGFILQPDERIANAVYSTGPGGRLTAYDCLNRISKMSKR